jgi:hypothetical protein
MPVAVRFECETEEDAIAVFERLKADMRVLATEIRLADGRTLEFDKHRDELLWAAKQNAGSGPGRADN